MQRDRRVLKTCACEQWGMISRGVQSRAWKAWRVEVDGAVRHIREARWLLWVLGEALGPERHWGLMN